MDKPLTNAPVLEGKDAESFLEKLYQRLTHVPTPEERKAQNEEMEKMKASYEALKSISDGAF
jgi:hypothetical protein